MKKLILVLFLCFVTSLCSAQTAPYFDDILPGVGKFSDGTAAAPSITFGSDPDTGLYRYGANQIGFSTGGFARAYIDANKLVCINSFYIHSSTADGSDNQLLSIGGGGATSSSRGAYIDLNGNESAAPGLLTLSGGNVTGAAVRFNTMAAERGRITENGNFLIGTTTDDGVNKLQVNGGLAIAGTAPASAGATGVAGSVRYDSSYIYICVATNTWKRVAISTW